MRQTTGLQVEICCSSVDDAIAAEQGGADRIELCSALSLGGLTPSAATIALTRIAVSLPIMALIRPRAGGFSYSASELRVMEADIDYAIEKGADGIVVGVLKPDGNVDAKRCAELRNRIGSREAVFHRAFDVTPDPFRALEELIDLGFTRILTSGQQDRAVAGIAVIRQLVERANGRIEILPGSGITPENVIQVIRETGSSQIHTSASAPVQDASTSSRRPLDADETAASFELECRATDARIVRSVVELVRHEARHKQ